MNFQSVGRTVIYVERGFSMFVKIVRVYKTRSSVRNRHITLQTDIWKSQRREASHKQSEGEKKQKKQQQMTAQIAGMEIKLIWRPSVPLHNPRMEQNMRSHRMPPSPLLPHTDA